MFNKNYLFKRGDFYHLQYFDERTQSVRRISTRKKTKEGAENFSREFSTNFETVNPLKNITIKKFRDEYLEYIKIAHSQKYYESVQISFRMLLRSTGNILLINFTLRHVENFVLQTY